MANTGTSSSTKETEPKQTDVTAIKIEPGMDKYFDKEDGLVAVFDFDYEKVIEFKTLQVKYGIPQGICCCTVMTVGYTFPLTHFVLVPQFGIGIGIGSAICAGLGASVACTACCHGLCRPSQNHEWNTRAQHVALNQDGIRYVIEKRKQCLGYEQCDQGKISKTISYEKITDCEVHEPAGATVCGLLPNVLSIVTVDTASGRELQLEGLKDTEGFKKAVWAMKRNGTVNAGDQSRAHVAPGQQSMMGGPQANADDPMEKLKKLKELLDVGVLSQDEYDEKKAELMERI